jgi:hypothetical protein
MGSDRSRLRLVDIADLLGVTKQRAHQLAERSDFPPPVEMESRKGRLWARSDFRRWARTYRGGDSRWGPRT